MIEEISQATGIDKGAVQQVVDQLAMQLHRRLETYMGMNGDYIGESLHWEVGPRAFYHLLGFLDMFAEKYEWEPGDAREYLLRLGSPADWAQYHSEPPDNNKSD